MFNYQISVSYNGSFVFRTDWILHRQEANRALSAIMHLRNDGYTIVIYRRNAVMESTENMSEFFPEHVL